MLSIDSLHYSLNHYVLLHVNCFPANTKCKFYVLLKMACRCSTYPWYQKHIPLPATECTASTGTNKFMRKHICFVSPTCVFCLFQMIMCKSLHYRVKVSNIYLTSSNALNTLVFPVALLLNNTKDQKLTVCFCFERLK